MKKIYLCVIVLNIVSHLYAQKNYLLDPQVNHEVFIDSVLFQKMLLNDNRTFRKADLNSTDVTIETKNNFLVLHDKSGLDCFTKVFNQGETQGHNGFWNFPYFATTSYNNLNVMTTLTTDEKSYYYGFKYYDYHGDLSKYIIVVHYFNEFNNTEYITNRDCFIIESIEKPRNYLFWGIKASLPISKIEIIQTGEGTLVLDEIIF